MSGYPPAEIRYDQGRVDHPDSGGGDRHLGADAHSELRDMTMFRRMDPQPEWVRISTPTQMHFAMHGVAYHPGTWCAVVWGGDLQHVDVPTDMSKAYPWRDRDGEWYWRKELHLEHRG